MFLKDHLVLASLGALILLVLGVLALVIRAAARSEPAAAGPRAPVRLRSDTLRASFRQAVELIESSMASRAKRYQLPWVLVLDEGDGSSVLPLAQSGIASALGTDAAGAAAAQGLTWHFFDQGVVIDVQGAYLGGADEGEQTGEQPWDQFLGLCREYRPARPFDAMVVTVPAALLLDHHADARLELARLAQRANRRVWLAQNRFAMRFALYVVVSGCEHLPGFSAYARALPDLLRKSMLGWSSPHDLTLTYRADWVEEALRQTRRTLADSTAELLALGAPDTDATACFLLPARIDALRPQLQLFVDELMRPSSYHEPFILRGLYFTGDASEVAERLARSAGHPAPGAADTFDGFPATRPVALADGLMPAEVDLGTPALPAEARQPVFLRDLFEQKVFREYGLTRPSGTQQLQRPLLGRGLRWAAIGLVGAWCVGLGVGSLILHRQSTVLTQVLGRLQSDTDTQLRAGLRGETMPAEWHRQRALGLLQLMEQMDRQRLWSLFMPGSWPVIDSLPHRVRDRLEQAFGDIAVSTLRNALYERTARLTGVAQDPSTGALVSGAPCSDPAGLPGPAAGAAPHMTLGFEDLGSFQRLLAYTAAAEQLDQATAALQRLLDPARPADGADLSLLVRVTLGAELPGRPDHAAALFRSRAAQGSGVATTAMQQALQCSLRRVATALLADAFEGNDLLEAQRAVVEQLEAAAGGESEETAAQTLAAWHALHDTIRSQQALLARGNGTWMHQTSFQPGAAWDRTLGRIAANRLLGPDTARALQADSEAAFQRFSVALAEQTGAEGETGAVWNDKTQRWDMAPGLTALHGALTALFNQPYMNGTSERPLPGSVEPMISWDLARLDQALAVGEQRKRFQAELLGRFPPDMQGAVAQLVDGQFARLISDHLSSALVPGARLAPPDAGTADAERSRLARIQGLLVELGAQPVLEALRNLQLRDASARLRQLDEALDRSELYAPQRGNFSQWRGERGPALAGFGLGDGAALAAYLGQQRARIETLGREAEMVIAQLGGRSGQSLLAERWENIARDLERYRLKNPNSSLLALENFLLTMGGDVDVNNCGERLGTRPAPATGSARGGDFFAMRQQQLASSLQQRCAELQGKDQQEHWGQFARQFNQGAAGRPPFVVGGWTADAPALDLDEIAALLPAFERAQRSLRQIGTEGGAPGAGAARRFVDQFDRMRTFLQPLLPAGEAATGYDLGVEFRARPQAEVEGNKIIDWVLEVGPQRLGWREPPRPLRWEPGMAVALHLRLAKDGPVVPRSDERQPALAVDGRSVTLRYADPWALLNLLQRHRENEAAGKADGRSQLLRIEFPLLATSVAGSETSPAAPAETRARVYLRLTLSPAGKRAPLAWPGPFPTRAPEPGAR